MFPGKSHEVRLKNHEGPLVVIFTMGGVNFARAKTIVTGERIR